MASFLGNLMKGGEQTALRKKKFTEGTLRYNLFRQAQETLKVILLKMMHQLHCDFNNSSKGRRGLEASCEGA